MAGLQILNLSIGVRIPASRHQFIFVFIFVG